AEVLRNSGYRTTMVGKWHLSLTRPVKQHMKFLNNQAILEQFGDPKSYPVARGFENHYGVIWGVVNFFDPFSLVQDMTPVQSVSDDYYITDAFTDSAIERISEYSAGEGPFFLYLAYTAPHWPLHARPEDIQKYNGTYDVGWQAIRKARYQRQLEMGLFKESSAALSSRHDADRHWDQEPEQAWESRAMAVHAAMIDRVDQSVGRIVESLRQHNRLDNTLILFLSDNGASPERPTAPGFDRTSQTRDGQAVTYFGQDQPKQIMPGPETTYAGIGPRWANVCNTPFRLWKAAQHEGGIRTPLIAHWPAGLKTKPGAIEHAPGHIIDVMATCVELAGVDYPARFNDHKITPLEGKSLLPIFQGRQRKEHEALYWSVPRHQAIRMGDWKAIRSK
ncbi:MAG: sulfatase-like hydrolase/transferase, partial [Planctomycetales bacterium]